MLSYSSQTPYNYAFNNPVNLNACPSAVQRRRDPALGRMTGIDIMAGKYSSQTPYNYAFNSPINLNDPSGADPMSYCLICGGLQNNPYSTYNDWWRSAPIDSGSGGPGSQMGGHITLGSAGDWANPYRTFSANVGAMSLRFAQNYYSGLSNQQRFNLAKSHSIVSFSEFEWYDPPITIVTGSLEDGTLTATAQRSYLVPKIIRKPLPEWQIEHLRTMNNPLVRAIHSGQSAFFSHPVTQGAIALLGGVVASGLGATYGLAVKATSLATRATEAERGVSAGIDFSSQVVFNTMANGGNVLDAISGVNVTSIAVSAFNPTAKFGNVILNSSVGSAFELRFSGKSDNIFTGKSISDIGRSALVAGVTYGAVRGFGLAGNSGLNYAKTRANSLDGAGFKYTSSAYNTVAWIGVSSKVLSTTGTNNAAAHASTVVVNYFGF